ncbi:hypothetical protein TREPR_1285 [Treponema primitia ZAS-2]|uniref:Uncharacterized protein n=1 Tax=Treponema primitia (strain ATCC BAA-887 / DSM 12427 / ZAS-2) TaxID=545694 RepID=F5YRE8_TREPZ|nr:hypothetical protein TREPR_1285 [Treponema primitia ZAS-2]
MVLKDVAVAAIAAWLKVSSIILLKLAFRHINRLASKLENRRRRGWERPWGRLWNSLPEETYRAP